jgi:hypothetical protein
VSESAIGATFSQSHGLQWQFDWQIGIGNAGPPIRH